MNKTTCKKKDLPDRFCFPDIIRESMIKIKEVVNGIFNSKTYIIYRKGERASWLVDIGDIDPILLFLKEQKLAVKGVFITHGHFDHIYGLQSLVDYYPECYVYATDYGKESLASDKLNMSRYHEAPFSYTGDNVIVVHEGDSLSLFEGEPPMLFFETPGHNQGCLTMVLGDFIFTGDAYIPGVGANTQVPRSNKEQAKRSLERILKMAEGKIILSGHKVQK